MEDWSYIKCNRMKMTTLAEKRDVEGRSINALKEFFSNVALKTSALIRWEHPLSEESRKKNEIAVKLRGNPLDVKEAEKMILKELGPEEDSVIHLKMDVCRIDHAVLVGKGGNNVQYMQMLSNCHIDVSHTTLAVTGRKSNEVLVCGERSNIETAKNMVRNEQLIRFSFHVHPNHIQDNDELTEPFLGWLTERFKFYLELWFIHEHLLLLTVYGKKRNYAIIRRGFMLLKKKIFKRNIPIRGFLHTEVGCSHQDYLVYSDRNIPSSIMKASNAKIVIPSLRNTHIARISSYIHPEVLKKLSITNVLILGDFDNVCYAYELLIKHLPVQMCFEVKHLITEYQLSKAISDVRGPVVKIAHSKWENMHQVYLTDEEQNFEKLLLLRKKIFDAVKDDDSRFESLTNSLIDSQRSIGSSSNGSNIRPYFLSENVQYTSQILSLTVPMHASHALAQNCNCSSVPNNKPFVKRSGFPLAVPSKSSPTTSVTKRGQRMFEPSLIFPAESANMQDNQEPFSPIYDKRVWIHCSQGPSTMHAENSMLMVQKEMALSERPRGQVNRNTACDPQTEIAFANSIKNKFGVIGSPKGWSSWSPMKYNFGPVNASDSSCGSVTGAVPRSSSTSAFMIDTTKANQDRMGVPCGMWSADVAWSPLRDFLPCSKIGRAKIDHPKDNKFSYRSKSPTNVQSSDISSYFEKVNSSTPKRKERIFRESLYAPVQNRDSFEGQDVLMGAEKSKENGACNNLDMQCSPDGRCRNSFLSHENNDSGISFTPRFWGSNSLFGSSPSESQSSQEVVQVDPPAWYPSAQEYKTERIRAYQTMWKDISNETVRVPNDNWSGHGFSRSMPESYLKNKFQNQNKMDSIVENEPSGLLDKLLLEDTLEPSPATGANYVPAAESENLFSTSNFFEAVPQFQLQNVELAVANFENLGDLLLKCDLGEYYSTFEYNEVDLETFLTLTDEDLQSLSINYSSRMRMLAVIAALQH